METRKIFPASKVFGLLLFASVLYQASAGIASTDKIICEHHAGSIECSHGTIHIIDSQYGRSAPGSVACPHPSIHTTSCVRDELAYAQDLCQDEHRCDLECRFSGDPCPGTYKYLNVTYFCTTTSTTMEATTTTAAATASRVVEKSKTERGCADGHTSVTSTLSCKQRREIVITRAFCLRFGECDEFVTSAFTSCTSADRTSSYHDFCSKQSDRHECTLTCTGSCPEQQGTSYLYVEYDCVSDGLLEPQTTTIATTTYSTTTTPQETTIATTTAVVPTDVPTDTLQTTLPSTTITPAATTSLATTKASSPEAVLEEFLAECFGNATAGEADVKPYRPLTFTSPGDDADSRLAVNFESSSLQTKPVKLAIAAFSEPSQSDGCGSVPDLPSNDTDNSSDGDNDGSSTESSRALNSVVNVTVFCFNGASLQLQDGEYVDVAFPAKIDFENEIPLCTSMRGAASDWKWTTDGCRVVYSNYTHVTCRCDHLAAIALERAPKGFAVGHMDIIALLLIERVLGGVSIICLLVMVMVYFILGNQYSQLAKVQLNIAVSCCLAHLIYLVGMGATSNLYACGAMAAVLQYLFTVYGSWLVVQTVLFLNTSYIHGKTREGLHTALVAPKTFTLELVPLTKTFFAVWGLPLAIVGLLYKEYPHAYGTPESCWLVESFTPYKVFMSMIVIGLLVNVLLSVITAYYVLKTERTFSGDDEDYEEWTDKLKLLVRWCLPTSVLLSLVLVFAWVLHVVYHDWSSLALDYMFHICVMSQGITVFMFYCVFNPQLRESHARRQSYVSEDKTSDGGTKDKL